MRVNVYSQELTNEIEVVETQVPDRGIKYSAVRLFLHSSERLHHEPGDDDRSAITFWLPKSHERREEFARALEAMAAAVRTASPETGND